MGRVEGESLAKPELRLVKRRITIREPFKIRRQALFGADGRRIEDIGCIFDERRQQNALVQAVAERPGKLSIHVPAAASKSRRITSPATGRTRQRPALPIWPGRSDSANLARGRGSMPPTTEAPGRLTTAISGACAFAFLFHQCDSRSGITSGQELVHRCPAFNRRPDLLERKLMTAGWYRQADKCAVYRNDAGRAAVNLV